jgi:excisionase family DNA binding protein
VPDIAPPRDALSTGRSTRGGSVGRRDLPLRDARLAAMTEPRFLRLSDVAEILNISAAQTYALVRNGELVAMKVGGRGQWRVEREQLEAFIRRAHEQTREFVDKHPFGRDDAPEDPAD